VGNRRGFESLRAHFALAFEAVISVTAREGEPAVAGELTANRVKKLYEQRQLSRHSNSAAPGSADKRWPPSSRQSLRLQPADTPRKWRASCFVCCILSCSGRHSRLERLAFQQQGPELLGSLTEEESTEIRHQSDYRERRDFVSKQFAAEPFAKVTLQTVIAV
jgi:hypothetical protein